MAQISESHVEQASNSPNIHVSLTHSLLSMQEATSQVKSSRAGAIVLFAGTTRDNFNGKLVKHLEYSAYERLALKTMQTIAEQISQKHALLGISIVHRLGVVPIGEESVIIAVAAPHRQAAWRAGEEALEEVKAKVEIWKLEEFGDGSVWRANAEGCSKIE